MYDLLQYNSKLIIYLYWHHRHRHKPAEDWQMFSHLQHYNNGIQLHSE